MAEFTETRPLAGPRASTSAPAYQAFRILHVAFVIAPTVAGLDKFFHVLTNWDMYLAPAIAHILPFSAHTFMLIVGVIEIVAGFLVALNPRIFAWVVAAWLLGIIVNLFISGHYFDIALRDFGLLLGAVALARLAQAHADGDLPMARTVRAA